MDEKQRLKQYAYRHEHMDKYREYSRKSHEKNKERFRVAEKERKYNLRVKLLTYYGNGTLACVWCSCTNIVCLTIDHINNDGAKHRKEIKQQGRSDIYRWLKKNNSPAGFQTLCRNCQAIKEDLRRKEWLKRTIQTGYPKTNIKKSSGKPEDS